MEVKILMISVYPKPLTVPMPKIAITPAAMTVVMFESMMVLSALREAGIERSAQCFPGAEFFFEALENNDVAVNGHADAKNQARDAGQRQRNTDDRKQKQYGKTVNQQRDERSSPGKR